MKKKVYIIGAGLAGLSAAYHLVKNGYSDIEVFEASPHAGGRCRSYFDEKLQTEIDNGNHLIMQANTSVLELIKELSLEDRFNKFDDNIFTFFDNRNNQRYYYKAPFPDIERFGFFNFFNLIKFVLIPSGKTVREAFRLSPNIYHKIINPVSRSILNTTSEIAYSRILRKVFLKIVTTKNGFHHYYPKNNWGNALITPLLEFLQNSGVKINYNKTLKNVHSSQNSILKLGFGDEEINTENSIVVFAAPPYAASKLVNIDAPNEFAAIVNVHFKLPHSLPAQIIGVINANIEWVFVKPDMISTTLSAATIQMSELEIAKDAWNMCSKILGIVENKMPEYRVLVEKRATFTCTKQQLAKRPDQKTKYTNLFLAGDYVNVGIPATIEAAVLSGKNVSNILAKDL